MAFNLLFVEWGSFPVLGRVSAYNSIFPGRLRFPFGENPTKSYNLTLNNIEAMFASHEINGEEKSDMEYRVIVLGDSSVWGTLLLPDETLPGQLNQLNLMTNDGRKVRFYNLGYPTLSLTKDIMLLNEAMRYSPDLILWPVTLESFVKSNQLASPIVANNLNKIEFLKKQYGINVVFSKRDEKKPLLEHNIINKRRELADLIRLQFNGVMWSATGIDQEYTIGYTPAMRDLGDEKKYYGWEPPLIPSDGLSFDIIEAGYRIAGDIPVILVNEPILISHGINNNIRYNFYYPRWVYDQFRSKLGEFAVNNSIDYIDLWDFVPENEFTNSAIHLNPDGVSMVADRLEEPIEKYLSR